MQSTLSYSIAIDTRLTCYIASGHSSMHVPIGFSILLYNKNSRLTDSPVFGQRTLQVERCARMLL